MRHLSEPLDHIVTNSTQLWLTRRSLPAVSLIASLLLSGCTARWHAIDKAVVAGLPTRQQVQVWSGNRTYQWHAVVLRSDSLTGIPFYRPTACDSGRVAIPWAHVDSMRAGNPVAGFWRSVGVVGLVALGPWYWSCFHTIACTST
jgi:hypothetical protein